MVQNRLSEVWHIQRRALAGLWRGLTSAYTLLGVTLAALAMAILSGLWFHGSASESGAEIAALARPGSFLARNSWLADLYAAWNWPTALDSWLSRILLALIALLALWQLLNAWSPSWSAPPRRLSAPYGLSLPCDSSEASRRLEQAFALGGRRLVRLRRAPAWPGPSAQSEDQTSVVWAVAERTGLARWLSGFFYLGLLLLVLAVIVGQRWNWSSPRLDLALGETRPLGQEDSLALRLERIEIFPQTEENTPVVRSSLSVLQGARVEDEILLRQGRPQRYQGLSLYQVGLGPAARVTARNAAGEAMAIQSLVGDTALQRSIRVRFSDQQQEQQVALPDADMVLRMVQYEALPQQGYSGSVLHAQLLRGTDGQLLDEQFLTSNGALSSGGVRVDVGLEYFVSVRAQRQPGLPLLAIAGMLVALGVLGLVLWPPRRAWLMVQEHPQGSLCHMVIDRRDVTAPWFVCAQSLLAEAAHE